jgi:hypothetical protein
MHRLVTFEREYVLTIVVNVIIIIIIIILRTRNLDSLYLY